MKAENLRKSILQYAIQGKLVSQIESEESASVLLEKIKAEKKELIKKGKLKKTKSLPDISEDEVPFELPDSWEWARFDTVSILYTGNSINAQEKKKKYTNLLDGYNYIATKDIGFDSIIDYDNGIKIPFNTTFKTAKMNSSLLCIEGGSAGRKVALLNQDVCFGNKLCSFESIIINEMYLFYYLQTPTFKDYFKDNTTGMIGGVGVNTLKTLCFAIPPLAEQQRIVARLEELMVLIDEYEKKEIELSILETEFPDKLKKSILQYAVQGKLVSQIENEEPARVLIEKIKSDKQEDKQSKLKKANILIDIVEEEKTFDIPESWDWCRLVEILQQLPRNGFSPNRVDKTTHTKVLTLTATTKGVLDLNQYKFVEDSIASNSYLWLKRNDILIQRSNSPDYVGIACLFDSDDSGYIFPDLMMKLEVSSFVDVQYILKVLHSPATRRYFREKASGTSDSMKKITQGIVANTIIPLPPYAEQKRIVARIEELFVLIGLISVGKKLKVPKVYTVQDNLDKTIEFVSKLQKNKFDINSLKFAARGKDGINEETIDLVKKQVQDFYDKKS